MERLVLWHRVLPAGQGHASSPEQCAQHFTTLELELSALTGEVLGRVGGAIAVAFPPDQLEDAVEFALAAVERAEAEEELPRIAIGLSLGEMEDAQGMMLGDCIDRAQLLANRARAYEVLLDANSRQRASGVYLFGRVVGTGSAAARGHAIDRRHPRRRQTRAALAKLRPAPALDVVAEVLGPALEGDAQEPKLLVARGPEGAGLVPVLRSHAAASGYAWMLELGGIAGGLEPLGSLRRALARATVADAVVGTDADPRLHAAEVIGGERRLRDAALEGWRKLLEASHDRGGGLVFLHLHEPVDVASIELVGAGLAMATGCRVVAAVPVDAPTPRALADEGQTINVIVPALRMHDARYVAAGVLGLDAGSDLARRVAVLGGDTPLGVEEAARTLVSSGDLIEDGGSWAWRVGPRGGVCALPTETLIEERVETLGELARRALDLLVTAPRATAADALRAMATRDGLDEEELELALSELRAEALVDATPSLGDAQRNDEYVINETLRALVLAQLPPARVSELRSYLVQSLTGSDATDAFGQATLGYLFAEAGDADAAAAALLTTAAAAHEAGWVRAAVRLAAVAVQTSPTADTRSAALVITRGRTGGTALDETGGDTAPDGIDRSFFAPDGDGTQGTPTSRAVKALVAGDFETVDGFIDLAVAEGHDLAATDRLRAMAHLLRKDVNAAQRLLDRAVERGGDDPRQLPRAALALAWMKLRRGQPQDALRDGLSALARSRELHDARGQAAALHTIAACYRHLGRDEQADRIVAASPA